MKRLHGRLRKRVAKTGSVALALLLVVSLGIPSAFAVEENEGALPHDSGSESNELLNAPASEPVFEELDPDEGIGADEPSKVPSYYEVRKQADNPEQHYTLYYYTVNGNEWYRVYGSVDGESLGYYAYDVDTNTVDTSQPVDQKEEQKAAEAQSDAGIEGKTDAEFEPEVVVNSAPHEESSDEQSELSTEDATVNEGEGATPSLLRAPADFTPASPNFKVTITGLAMTPASDIWPGTKTTMSFNWSASFVNVQNSFQAGDTVTIPTNVATLFNFGGAWTHNLATPSGTVVATLAFSAAQDAIVITFNDAAAGLTSLQGTFPGYYEQMSAKNLDLGSDTDKELTVADVSTTLGFKGGKHLSVASTGSGSAQFVTGDQL